MWGNMRGANAFFMGHSDCTVTDQARKPEMDRGLTLHPEKNVLSELTSSSPALLESRQTRQESLVWWAPAGQVTNRFWSFH